jgi:protocatechuate 3,4-dioxygenase beta subunit
MTGTRLNLRGFVLTTACTPIANAKLDFWQANAQGQYDNAGYTLRGHQMTDADGRFVLETVVPGLYPGRTDHIHVKVQAPGGPLVTTQLYFPGVASNARDPLYQASLQMTLVDGADGKQATFNFVVATA